MKQTNAGWIFNLITGTIPLPKNLQRIYYAVWFTATNVGSRITYNKNHGKYFRCICSRYKQGSKFCSSIHLREDELIRKVFKDVKKQLQTFLKKDKLNYSDTTENDLNSQKIQELNAILEEKNKILKALYQDKISGVISQGTFIELTKQYEEEKKSLQQRIREEQKRSTTTIKKEDLREIADSYLNCEDESHMDRNMLLKIIDRIEIDDRDIIITYHFNTET